MIFVLYSNAIYNIKKKYFLVAHELNWIRFNFVCSGWRSQGYFHKQIHIHVMASNPNRWSKAAIINNRFRAELAPGASNSVRGPSITMVECVSGSNWMLQQQRKVQLRHCRLHLRSSRMQWCWFNPAGNQGRNYRCRKQRTRFLRHEQRGRLQHTHVLNRTRWKWRLQNLRLS